MAVLLLQKAGKNVMLAEANTIGFGTTVVTSTHINNFADTAYKELIKAASDKMRCYKKLDQ